MILKLVKVDSEQSSMTISLLRILNNKVSHAIVVLS